jgi:uncharacterized protein (TIGR04222 family)
VLAVTGTIDYSHLIEQSLRRARIQSTTIFCVYGALVAIIWFAGPLPRSFTPLVRIGAEIAIACCFFPFLARAVAAVMSNPGVEGHDRVMRQGSATAEGIAYLCGGNRRVSAVVGHRIDLAGLIRLQGKKIYVMGGDDSRAENHDWASLLKSLRTETPRETKQEFLSQCRRLETELTDAGLIFNGLTKRKVVLWSLSPMFFWMILGLISPYLGTMFRVYFVLALLIHGGNYVRIALARPRLTPLGREVRRCAKAGKSPTDSSGSLADQLLIATNGLPVFDARRHRANKLGRLIMHPTQHDV